MKRIMAMGIVITLWKFHKVFDHDHLELDSSGELPWFPIDEFHQLPILGTNKKWIIWPKFQVKHYTNICVLNFILHFQKKQGSINHVVD